MSQNTPGTSVYHDTAHGTVRVAPVADRPILFSAPMVRALLEGRKTQTRRVAKFVEEQENGLFHIRNAGGGSFNCDADTVAEIGPDYAPYEISDRLWVRETLVCDSNDQGAGWMSYAADGKVVFPPTVWRKDRKTIVSIHMPRWAPRLTIVVTDVRVQRLHDISDEDALEEGIRQQRTTGWFSVCGFNGAGTTARAAYALLWNHIHGPGSWDANPFIAAYSFTVHHCNIDAMPAPTAAAAE